MPKKLIQTEPDVYRDFRMLPIIDEILLEDQRRYRESYRSRKVEQADFASRVFDTSVDVLWNISPSTASLCLRWVAYEMLEKELGVVPVEANVRSNLAMMMGSACHYAIQKKIKDILGGEVEVAFRVDEADLSGRVDLLFMNRKTKKPQILEMKFSNSFPFKKLTREGLPSYLKYTPWVINPQREHYKQVLLYLWSLNLGYEKARIPCANILYFDRSSGERKEALVPWNEITEYDAEEFVKLIIQAKAMIDKGQLPPPSVESDHVCGSFCPYRLCCEYGQGKAGIHERKTSKRKPANIYRKVREAREKKVIEMQTSGITQLGLAFEELSITKKPEVKIPNAKPLLCGDCATAMVWNGKKGKQSHWVCPNCGDR